MLKQGLIKLPRKIAVKLTVPLLYQPSFLKWAAEEACSAISHSLASGFGSGTVGPTRKPLVTLEKTFCNFQMARKVPFSFMASCVDACMSEEVAERASQLTPFLHVWTLN